MPNTNFQTIHQMGSAINSFVKQATGRDNMQNIDMEHITVAQNHYYEDVDISGRVVSFNEGAAGIPLGKCLVQIEPMQEGTGDPSPDNVRPISGWDGVKVTVSPTTDKADGQTYSITFPSEAGKVYGGTLDVTTGVLTVDMAMVDLGTLEWNYSTDGVPRFGASFPSEAKHRNLMVALKGLSSMYRVATFGKLYDPHISENGLLASFSTTRMAVRNDAYTDTETFKTAMSGVQLVYELATPITYQLTPQEVKTLPGVNNIWADTGDIEVKFKKIKEFF